MGLDQYAYTVKKKLNTKPFAIQKDSVIDGDFMYWRKNRQLQGWMQNLYVKKCNALNVRPDESFNCIPMELTKEDIKNLAFDIRHGILEDANGFFWGNGEYETEDATRDLKFCKRALEAMEDDTVAVYYDCWY